MTTLPQRMKAAVPGESGAERKAVALAVKCDSMN